MLVCNIIPVIGLIDASIIVKITRLWPATTGPTRATAAHAAAGLDQNDMHNCA